MKKIIYSLLVLVLAATTVLIASAKAAGPTPTPSPPAKSEPIVLRGVTFCPRSQSSLVNWYQMIDEVKKQSNGRLVLDYRGGPEVIPPPALGKAVVSGAVDIAACIGEHYEPVVPLAGILSLSRLTWQEERKPGGANDLLQEYHRKAGLYYLGRTTSMSKGFFYCMFKKKIDKPQQLAGLRIGGIGNVHYPFQQAFGSAPVLVKAEEMYTSLERGVIDIAYAPFTEITDRRYYETASYLLDLATLNAPGNYIINIDKWNKIPKGSAGFANKGLRGIDANQG